MKLIADEEGRGSFKDICDYVEAVLRENFEVIPEENVGSHDPYERRARNIVMSVLTRLGIEVERTDREVL